VDADKIFAGIEKFFFDIVGSVIPGILLVAGVWVTVFPDVSASDLKVNQFGDWFMIAVAYVIGQGLATLGEHALVPFAALIVQISHRSTDNNKRVVLSRKHLREQVANRKSVKLLVKKLWDCETVESSDVHELRNAALTLITPEEKATVVRFMFLSLLSLGVAVDIVIMGFVHFIGTGFDVGLYRDWLIAAASLAVTGVFMLRHFEFYRRAIQTPFDIAAAKINEARA
jgi:hypothetical protein